MKRMSDFYSAIDLVAIPIFVFDKEYGTIIYSNAKAISLFKLENVNRDLELSDLCRYPDILTATDVLEMFSTLSPESEKVFKWPVNYNDRLKYFTTQIGLRRVEGKEVVVATFAITDNSAQKSQQPDSMGDFREVLHAIFEKINTVPLGDIPKLIKESLKNMSEFLGCERSFVYEFSSDYKYCTKIYGWNTKEFDNSNQSMVKLPTSTFAWAHNKILNKEIVSISSLDELPESASEEREKSEIGGLKSFLLIPFMLGDRVIGHIGLECFDHEKRWTDREVSNLKLMVKGVASMLFRYKNERLIEEQEALYQAIFNSANDSIIIFEDGLSVDCNPKALELFRCTKSELIGIGEKDFTPLSQADGYPSEGDLSKIEDFKENGTPVIVEDAVKRPDDTTFISEISYNVYEVTGHSYVIAIFRDVSNRILSVDKLKAKENFLRTRIEYLLAPSKDIEKVTLKDLFDVTQLQNLQDALVDAIGVSSVFTNVDGTAVTKAEDLNGICRLVGDTERGHSLCKKTSDVMRERLIENPSPHSMECLSCGFIDSVAPIIVEGKHIGNWFIGQVIPEKFEKDRLLTYAKDLGLDINEIEKMYEQTPRLNTEYFNKILKLVNVLANELSILGYKNLKLAKTIQEHLELEKQLRQTKNRAEESDRLKSAFLANLSHEIRTPMNGIVGFSDLLQMEEILPEERKEYVALIKQSSNQLLNIINDIIDISKIESGQVDLNVSTFNLNSVLREHYVFFKKLAQNKNIELRINIIPDQEELLISTDEIKLRQILMNLISNAIKFTDVGFVRFGYEKHNDKLLFVVEDTGAGIDEEGVKNVFDRFWQSKRNDPNKGGTGLGLAITKAYVELLGGEIRVSSVPGAGTKFEFEIPSGI